VGGNTTKTRVGEEHRSWAGVELGVQTRPREKGSAEKKPSTRFNKGERNCAKNPRGWGVRGQKKEPHRECRAGNQIASGSKNAFRKKKKKKRKKKKKKKHSTKSTDRMKEIVTAKKGDHHRLPWVGRKNERGGLSRGRVHN